MVILRVAALLCLALLGACERDYDYELPQLPNGGRPLTHTAFPAITDWSSLHMRLTRTVCYGRCPAYTVEIAGDGTVTYDGQMFVAILGHHVRHIPPAAVQQLFAAFREADFFWLHGTYRASITDNPTHTLSLAYDGHGKTVEDYAGRYIGMPRAVTELEEAVNSLAGTGIWVSGGEPAFVALKAEGWDFRADDAAHRNLVFSAAQSGNRELVADLIAAGVRVAGMPEGCFALEQAASAGRRDLMALLLAAEAPMRWGQVKLPDGRYDPLHPSYCDVLQAAAGSGVPAVVQLALSRQSDVNWSNDGDGNTALTHVASRAHADPRADHDFAGCAALLIAAGADVNVRDRDTGRTPLIDAIGDEAVVRLLLKAGAKVDAADEFGETALHKSYRPGVAEALLEAGADPWKKNDDGKTALDSASGNADPGTFRVIEVWMALHPKGKAP